MDIAKLLKQEAQFSAEVAEILKGRKPTPADLQRPLDLQQEQLTRVTDRIQALQEDKKAYAARIDAEIAELKGELGSRQRTMDAQREELKSAMNAATAVGRSSSTESTAGVDTTRPTGTVRKRGTKSGPRKTVSAHTRAKPEKT